MNKQTGNNNFYLIGIGNHAIPKLDNSVLKLIKKHRVFSGGSRHYELVKSILPNDYQWIDIKGKMDNVIRQYTNQAETVVVFVSGDPFFFGFGNTLKRLLPKAQINTIPYFNSIQLLCHNTQLNYSEIKTISLHGRRSWKALDEALINQEPLIGILTDETHSPSLIAQRLLTYNFSNYKIIIGEELEGTKERISEISLEEAQNYHAQQLNCVILQKTNKRAIPKSIPDTQFQTLEGRPGMITKQAIRLLTLEALNLPGTQCFWDIGSCTGSIAIESKLRFPHLDIIAFEKRPACEDIIINNSQSHHAPDIQIEMGDFFSKDLTSFKKPQSVFIGGHGNRLKEMIHQIHAITENGATVVMNTVLEKSFKVFKEEFSQLDYQLEDPLKIVINEHNPVQILTARKI